MNKKISILFLFVIIFSPIGCASDEIIAEETPPPLLIPYVGVPDDLDVIQEVSVEELESYIPRLLKNEKKYFDMYMGWPKNQECRLTPLTDSVRIEIYVRDIPDNGALIVGSWTKVVLDNGKYFYMVGFPCPTIATENLSKSDVNVILHLLINPEDYVKKSPKFWTYFDFLFFGPAPVALEDIFESFEQKNIYVVTSYIFSGSDTIYSLGSQPKKWIDFINFYKTYNGVFNYSTQLMEMVENEQLFNNEKYLNDFQNMPFPVSFFMSGFPSK